MNETKTQRWWTVRWQRDPEPLKERDFEDYGMAEAFYHALIASGVPVENVKVKGA